LLKDEKFDYFFGFWGGHSPLLVKKKLKIQICLQSAPATADEVVI